MGAARRVQREAPLACVWGVQKRALSLTRPPPLRACSPGPLPAGYGCCYVCRRRDSSPTPQRALLRAGFARGRGDTRAPGGWRLLPACRASWIERSPTPDRPPWGVLPGHATQWLSVRTLWASGPVTNPTARALASSLCALWGRHDGVQGGGGLVQGFRSWALSLTRQPVLGACGGGLLPTGCGCGGFRRGDPSPTPQHALLGAGGGTRAPRGGHHLPACGMSWFGRSPTPDRPSSGCAAGARYSLAVGLRDHLPHSARSCELALRTADAVRGCPWGGGASCLRVSSPTFNRPPWGVRPGSATNGAWEPVTYPTARALASWLCTLWGHHKGGRGGGDLPPCGASRVWRSPTPDRPSLGGTAGARYPVWVRCAGGGALLSLVPSPVLHFVVCCAHFPGLHLVAVSVWHLSLCRGCGRRLASLACVGALRWCAAPLLLRSLPVL